METPEAISVSQINLYRTCSLKYRFQYIDQLPRLVRAAGLVFGSAVHKALEWFYMISRSYASPRATFELLVALRVSSGASRRRGK